MRRMRLIGLLCFGLLLAWVASAFAADGEVVRPVGVSDLSIPAVLFLMWREARKLWLATIEVMRLRADSAAALAAKVDRLTSALDRDKPDAS